MFKKVVAFIKKIFTRKEANEELFNVVENAIYSAYRDMVSLKNAQNNKNKKKAKKAEKSKAIQSRVAAEKAISLLLPEGKLPEGAMLETFSSCQLRLVLDFVEKGHCPGLDGMYDNHVWLEKPEEENLQNDDVILDVPDFTAFLRHIDYLINVTHQHYDRYVSGYYWC